MLHWVLSGQLLQQLATGAARPICGGWRTLYQSWSGASMTAAGCWPVDQHRADIQVVVAEGVAKVLPASMLAVQAPAVQAPVLPSRARRFPGKHHSPPQMPWMGAFPARYRPRGCDHQEAGGFYRQTLARLFPGYASGRPAQRLAVDASGQRSQAGASGCTGWRPGPSWPGCNRRSARRGVLFGDLPQAVVHRGLPGPALHRAVAGQYPLYVAVEDTGALAAGDTDNGAGGGAADPGQFAQASTVSGNSPSSSLQTCWLPCAGCGPGRSSPARSTGAAPRPRCRGQGLHVGKAAIKRSK